MPLDASLLVANVGCGHNLDRADSRAQLGLLHGLRGAGGRRVAPVRQTRIRKTCPRAHPRATVKRTSTRTFDHFSPGSSSPSLLGVTASSDLDISRHPGGTLVLRHLAHPSVSCSTNSSWYSVLVCQASFLSPQPAGALLLVCLAPGVASLSSCTLLGGPNIIVDVFYRIRVTGLQTTMRYHNL